MKKIILSLALAAFIGAGTVTPALACEGGKCTMAHNDKDAKSKKGKKAAAKSESCHMTKTASAAGSTPACCMKKDGAKAETTKTIKEAKAQR